MVNSRLLLVSIVVFCVFFEGDALKCYKGQSDKSNEPILVDCQRNEDVCVSSFTKTEVILDHRGNAGDPIPAGSWDKNCFIRSNLPHIFEELREFDNDQSDRCIEIKSSFVKSGKLVACVCSTDGCNQEIELDVEN